MSGGDPFAAIGMIGDGAFTPLTRLLGLLTEFDVRVGGGWGIDALAGRVTREHHDVDLFLPEGDLPAATARLTTAGWREVLDEWPWRTVLSSPTGGQADLGGIRYRTDGHGIQVDDEGDLELFPAWAWTECRVGDQMVVCLTAEAQRLKHRGYPERPGDVDDLAVIVHIDDPPRFDPRVWAVPPGAEEELLAGIERASDLLFKPYGLRPLPAMDPVAAAAEASRTVATLAIGRPPVGFWRLELVDGHPHIGQLSVLAEYGQQGLGRSLIESTCEWARGRGHHLVSLTTFAEVPFNAPFYRRAGFADLGVTAGTELAEVVAREADLSRLGPRVVLARSLELR